MAPEKTLKFSKMHGSGNDFILIDNRNYIISPKSASDLAITICQRKLGIGADGLILIEPPTLEGSHFKWRFLNSDGSMADMCGNGGRCAARFAFITGIAPESMTFETGAGLITAQILPEHRVKLKLPNPSNISMDNELLIKDQEFTLHSINTGVPHAICITDTLNTVPVTELGRTIRFHEKFQPEGTNVNFVCVQDKHTIKIRTYERGVEDETLACGTGSVAGAIITAIKGLTQSPVEVETQGGEKLKVYFNTTGTDITEVFLEADTFLTYTGYLDGDLKV